MTGLSAALFAKYLCLLRRGKPLAFRMGSWNGAKPNLDGRTGHFRYNRHFGTPEIASDCCLLPVDL